MKRAKTIIFIILALLGLLAAALLVKKSTEVRKGAYAGKVNLFLITGNTEEPNTLKLCKGNDGNYHGKLIVNLDPAGFKIPGAALKFAFDNTKIKIDGATFHSAYGASIWNSDKANTDGVLKITALSLQKDLPTTVFNLAEIQITALNIVDVSEFKLIYGNANDYQIVFEQ